MGSKSPHHDDIMHENEDYVLYDGIIIKTSRISWPKLAKTSSLEMCTALSVKLSGQQGVRMVMFKIYICRTGIRALAVKI
jgi:hypothetical protein